MRKTLRDDTPKKVAERYKKGGFGKIGSPTAKRLRREYSRNLKVDNLPTILYEAYKRSKKRGKK